MCRHCVQFGDGTKWYLNPKNYSDEVIYGESTKEEMGETMLGPLFGIQGTMQEIMTTAQRFKYDIGFGEHIDGVFQDLDDDMARTMREGLPPLIDKAVGGQVVPLEDAEKIMDLNEGEIFVLPCVCRKYYGGIEHLSCMFLRPAAKPLQENLSWETPNKMVSKEEAKEMLRKLDKEGFVHSIFWTTAPIPTMLCNCDYPYCIAIRVRLHYDIVDATRKGEYAALVDAQKCNGCGGTPKCLTKCQFGALKYSPTNAKSSVNQFQCWGCGLCRGACPNDAITLISREEIPQLKNIW
ncbi:MAG: ATP-binding protein [Candidatus Hodarchaeota archaeon]